MSVYKAKVLIPRHYLLLLKDFFCKLIQLMRKTELESNLSKI